jgi:methionine aminopeptidase
MSGSTIVYKTQEQIELIRKSSLLVGKTLAEVARHLKPGITTLELDTIAEKFILAIMVLFLPLKIIMDTSIRFVFR